MCGDAASGREIAAIASLDTICIRSLLCAASAPRLMPATNAATIAQTITPSFRDEGLSHRSCLLKRSRSRRFIETPITKRAQTASGSPQLLSTIIENLIKRRFREHCIIGQSGVHVAGGSVSGALCELEVLDDCTLVEGAGGKELLSTRISAKLSYLFAVIAGSRGRLRYIVA